ncbi:hypothetical protein F-S17_0232 [Faustovirus]|nr:hypothetical protein F-S17_0232 [Faustovirus]
MQSMLCQCCKRKVTTYGYYCFTCWETACAPINPAITKLKKECGDDIPYISLYAYDASIQLSVKYSSECLYRVVDKLCEFIGGKYRETIRISDKHSLQIINWHGYEVQSLQLTKCDPTTIYIIHLYIRLRQITPMGTLVSIAAATCARYGRIEGLTDDTIDHVLNIDSLLAVRFLFQPKII